MNDSFIEPIESLGKWKELSSDWNQLLEASAYPTFFLTWEWLSSWVECCFTKTRRLFILAVYKKEKLIGAAPFYIETKKLGPFRVLELRLLGSFGVGFDYLDVIAKRGKEKKVVNAIYEYLMNGKGCTCWDQMAFTDVRTDSLFFLYFHLRLETDGKYFEIRRRAFCPIMDLPQSESELFQERVSKGWRKKFKQIERVAERESNVSCQSLQEKEAVEGLKDFFEFYERQTGRKGKYLLSVLERVAEKYNSSPPLQLDTIFIDGQTVASLLHIKHKATLSLYLMAVNKKYNPKISIGNLVIGKAVKNAICEGFNTYDFLRGEERYKFHWANRGICTIELNFWQRRPLPLYKACKRLCRHAGKLFLR